MRSKNEHWSLQDPLYGQITLPEAVAELAGTPAMQRLRRIRLSNIDSLDLPGIAEISRFEHAIGTCHLASLTPLVTKLVPSKRLEVLAAALLHDVAIAPYGHLLEEALAFAGQAFNHETKFSTLMGTEDSSLGGANPQLFCGREAGIGNWAQKWFGGDFNSSLRRIFGFIKGEGAYGRLISGDLDVDNLDNIARIAHHAGLDGAGHVSLKLSAAIQGVTSDGALDVPESAAHLVADWISMREVVYRHLMFARRDFIGKSMLTWAFVLGFERGCFEPSRAWSHTDDEVIARLRRSEDREIQALLDGWQLADTLPVTDLLWMGGHLPARPELRAFAKVLETSLGRPCFAYGIADKMHRLVTIASGGTRITLGSPSNGWLLGVISSKRTDFTRANLELIRRAAETHFAVSAGPAPLTSADEQVALFG